MRNAIAGGALALALSFNAGWAQAPSNPKVAVQFAKANAEHEAGDYKAAHTTLAALTSAHEFRTEEPEIRGLILALDAEVASDLGMSAYAAAAARSASKLPGQEGFVAQVALLDAIRRADDAAMRRALTVLATDFPAALRATPDLPIQIAAGRPTPDAAAKAAQAQLAEALVANWRPKDPAQGTDYLKVAVIENRLAAGEVERARELTGSLDASNIVTTIRSDRRYDELFEGGWTLPTPREMTETQLARLRATRARFPRRLSLARKEADLLRTMGAEPEALQIVDTAIDQAKRSPASFDDAEIFLATLYELKVELLDALSRHEEAIETARLAARVPQTVSPTFSCCSSSPKDLPTPNRRRRCSSLAGLWIAAWAPMAMRRL